VGATPSAIDVERLDDGAIVVVTSNRPHRRNALEAQILAELHRLLDTLNGHPAARAVVLTGAGSAFCAGADIKAQPDDLVDAAATPQTALQAAASSTVAITLSARLKHHRGQAALGG
jgi:enoyl-CoA hydratase